MMVPVVSFINEPATAVGLATILSKQSGFWLARICSSYADLDEALASFKSPILLLDVTPVFTVHILSEIHETAPDCLTILWVNDVSTEIAHQAIELGVCGILPKTSPVDTLITCLKVVSEGGLWLEEALIAEMRENPIIKLSHREGQLVDLLTAGMKNKEIAALLRLSEGTVKVYLVRLFRKLGVKDRFELAICGLHNLARAGVNLNSQRGLRHEKHVLSVRSLMKKPPGTLSPEASSGAAA